MYLMTFIVNNMWHSVSSHVSFLNLKIVLVFRFCQDNKRILAFFYFEMFQQKSLLTYFYDIFKFQLFLYKNVHSKKTLFRLHSIPLSLNTSLYSLKNLGENRISINFIMALLIRYWYQTMAELMKLVITNTFSYINGSLPSKTYCFWQQFLVVFKIKFVSFLFPSTAPNNTKTHALEQIDPFC